MFLPTLLKTFLTSGVFQCSSGSRLKRLILQCGAGTGLLLAGAIPLRAQFANATTASGINYVHADAATAGAPEQYNGLRIKTPYSNLAGAAALDVNGDGWTDFIAARAHQPPVLYINQGNGSFQEQAAARGLGGAVDASAFCGADFDNDGDVDLFVVPHRGFRYWLYINDGSGNFTEEAVARGADVTTILQAHQGYSIAAADYDRDGYLDVYVCEWGIPVATEPGKHSVLLRNLGAGSPGYFENVTAAAGLVPPDNRWHLIYNFSAAWADFDGDGWTDLYIVGDLQTSHMYWNNGDGTFSEDTVGAGLGLEEAGMGVAVADYDHDGLLDLYVSSIYDQVSLDRFGILKGNKLYQNVGSRRFADTTTDRKVDNAGWSWGVAFLDFNNDTRTDILAANGMDASELGEFGPFYDALTDNTALFVYSGSGPYRNVAVSSNIRDTGMSKAVVVLDYDKDGDEDFLLTNTFNSPILYRNDMPASGREWIRFRFQGTASNRDGIGAVVRVTEGGTTQTALYNPTNNYIGEREPVLHIGVGAAGGSIDALEVLWPSGASQQITDAALRATNQVHLLVEPPVVLTPPIITTQPVVSGALAKDDELVLTVEASGTPAPVFGWEKDGVAIPHANGRTFRIKRLHPNDAGVYRVSAINTEGTTVSDDVVVELTIDAASHSVARWWDEFLLEAIRTDYPNPPVHGRNLYHLSAAMWDAFWPYQADGWGRALPVFHRETVTPTDWIGGREEAQRKAISYAAYRVLTQRFQNSPGKDRSLFGFRWLMEQLGYDPNFSGTVGNDPAAVGNRIGLAVLAATINDGANESGGYADITGYTSVNDPMIVALPGTMMNEPNYWQPLALDQAITQNDIPLPEGIQTFVGVNALTTTPFALLKPTPTSYVLDPGPPPMLGTATEADFIAQAVELIEVSSWLDPTDGVTIDISPGARFKNPLGSNAGTGYPVNPVTGQPYAPNVVRRADYARVLAEFWADGPASETPPGHWNVVLNQVTEHPLFERRYAGQGPILSPLEWDVRAYLALNGAVHDAACAAWGIKRLYDSVRPISMIRYLGGLGQSSDPEGPSYHPQGLPLIPNLIEVITAQTSAAEHRHAALAGHVGEIAIRAWRGNPTHPHSEVGGVGWILAANWAPYQKATFVSPAFPGYVSGHSTFSRAAAETLTLLTGSPYFPGGLGEYHFAADDFLVFEAGPTSDLALQWATYYDASDQAGRSRLFGGIHIEADDFEGRKMGSRLGLDAFLKAQQLRNGGAPSPGLINLSTRGRTGVGEDALIAGFVVDGDADQTTLVRMVGPELARLGITQPDGDPALEIHQPNNAVPLFTNADWEASPRAAQIVTHSAAVGAFHLDAGSTSSADLLELPPGLYTVINASAQPAARGIALAEVYGRKLINLSTRGSVGGGQGVLIAGFALQGIDPTPLLIRGVGPGLARLGVNHVLADPVIELNHLLPDGTWEVVATNDNWSQGDTASLSLDASARTGAFSLAPGSADAALLVQLPAGIYSAVLRSADGSEGVALVEVYHVK